MRRFQGYISAKKQKKKRKHLERKVTKEAEGKRKELGPEELLKKMQKRIDEEIAGGNKFVELMFGYIWSLYNIDQYSMRVGEKKEVFVHMATP